MASIQRLSTDYRGPLRQRVGRQIEQERRRQKAQTTQITCATQIRRWTWSLVTSILISSLGPQLLAQSQGQSFQPLPSAGSYSAADPQVTQAPPSALRTIPQQGELRQRLAIVQQPAPDVATPATESPSLVPIIPPDSVSPNQSTGSLMPPPPPDQQRWGQHSLQAPRYLPDVETNLGGEALTLSDVVASVYRSFPEIEQARLTGNLTAGQQMAAMGQYDLKLEGYTLNQPVGFYRSYRQGIGLARQTWWGGYLSSGYRLGRGEIEPWYKERQTNTGGEFKLAMVQPLLQGRAIDPYRVELFQANLRRQAVGPEIQENLLYVSRDAADAYWAWVAAGVTLRSQWELLRLAEIRDNQLREMLKVGQEKVINLVVNEQLIAERRGKLVESEQKFWQSASKLSLYLRDENGQPLVANPYWLPGGFAIPTELPEASFDNDLVAAVSRRPELVRIDLQIQEVMWDVRLANNQLLPEVDFTIQGKQGLGEPLSSTSIDDKGPFQLEAGLIGEVPLQRRKARGKITANNAKIDILNQKRRYQADKIGIELQTSHTALIGATESIRQAKVALDASRKTLDAYRFAFEKGQLDLVVLNLVEPKVTENQIKLYEQEQKWYSALAAKQAALGLDPLEQSLLIPTEPPHVPSNEDLPFSTPKANDQQLQEMKPQQPIETLEQQLPVR